MRIVAYTYNAGVHCLVCTKAADRESLVVNNYHPHAVSLGSPPAMNRDENGLHYNLTDREGNLIHPVFDIDERNFTHCSTCGELL